MLASDNTIIENTAETIYRLSADEAIRELCEAREDYYRLQRTIQIEIDEQKTQIDEQKTQIEHQQSQLEQQQSKIDQQKSQLEQKDDQLDKQEQYMQRTKQLFSFLARDMRHEDLQRACVDEDFLKELLDEYHV